VGLMFVRKDAAQELMGAPNATSLLLVTPDEGVTPMALRERLNDLPGTDALLKSTITNNDQQLFARAFGGPLRLMVVQNFLEVAPSEIRVQRERAAVLAATCSPRVAQRSRRMADDGGYWPPRPRGRRRTRWAPRDHRAVLARLASDRAPAGLLDS
jgi:hypothetical protein